MTKPANEPSPTGDAGQQTKRQAALARRRARLGFGPTVLGQRLEEPEWRGHWRSLKFL